MDDDTYLTVERSLSTATGSLTGKFCQTLMRDAEIVGTAAAPVGCEADGQAVAVRFRGCRHRSSLCREYDVGDRICLMALGHWFCCSTTTSVDPVGQRFIYILFRSARGEDFLSLGHVARSNGRLIGAMPIWLSR
jgi:hypothetical protein